MPRRRSGSWKAEEFATALRERQAAAGQFRCMSDRYDELYDTSRLPRVYQQAKSVCENKENPMQGYGI
jgi:hypothetical protein